MSTAITQVTVPPELVDFFAKPPLLITENGRIYEWMFAALYNTIKPQNFIEWILTRNITNLNWEIDRLERHKASLINAAWKPALRMVLETILEGDDAERRRVAQELTDAWFADPDAGREKIDKLLTRHQLSRSDVVAQAMALRLPELESINNRLERAMASRQALERDIEHQRVAGTWRMPKDLPQIVDAAAEKIPLAPSVNSGTHHDDGV